MAKYLFDRIQVTGDTGRPAPFAGKWPTRIAINTLSMRPTYFGKHTASIFKWFLQETAKHPSGTYVIYLTEYDRENIIYSGTIKVRNMLTAGASFERHPLFERYFPAWVRLSDVGLASRLIYPEKGKLQRQILVTEGRKYYARRPPVVNVAEVLRRVTQYAK